MNARADFTASLSILLQGPLSPSNHALVARMCRHWRSLFPAAPIILSLSQITCDTGDADVALSLRTIWEACTEVLEAPPATVLPPVKHGIGANHVNLQIAAARRGLERVLTEHVLRIRNDMAFADGGFVAFHLAHRDLPRGAGAVLAERVLISPWFTLDPLTLERLPFHFSDWFHLGRTSDVRALWDVPDMTLADATYYRHHPKRPDSHAREAGFLSRLAAEQHLVANAYRRLGHPVALAVHNDPSGAEASLTMLADDFIVADFDRTPIVFDKYLDLQDAADIDLVCVTYADWHALVDNAGRRAPHAVFAAKVARAGVQIASERRKPRRWWRFIGR